MEEFANDFGVWTCKGKAGIPKTQEPGQLVPTIIGL